MPWSAACTSRIAKGTVRQMYGTASAKILRVLPILGAPAEVLQQFPGPFLVAVGGAEEVDVAVADRASVAGRAQNLHFTRDRRLRGIVGDVEAVVVIRAAIEILARAERLRRSRKLVLERIRINELLDES